MLIPSDGSVLMPLINTSRKCLWARYILWFICKIIQSLPTNDGGRKMTRRTQHASGARCSADRRPHLSQPLRNCIEGSSRRAHNTCLNEVVWRDGNYGLLSLSPGATGRRWKEAERSWTLGACAPRPLCSAGSLSRCQRRVERQSGISVRRYEGLLGVKWGSTEWRRERRDIVTHTWTSHSTVTYSAVSAL